MTDATTMPRWLSPGRLQLVGAILNLLLFVVYVATHQWAYAAVVGALAAFLLWAWRRERSDT